LTRITIAQRVASAVFLLLLFNVVLANTLAIVPAGVGNSTFTNQSSLAKNNEINSLSDNLNFKTNNNIKFVVTAVVFILFLFLLLLVATFLNFSWFVKLPAILLITVIVVYLFHSSLYDMVGVFI
jgi:hypothetical protein